MTYDPKNPQQPQQQRPLDPTAKPKDKQQGGGQWQKPQGGGNPSGQGGTK